MIKAPSGTIWVDVTMLVNWSGNLTGIQRVEYNLAKRFAGQPNVKFCVFNKSTRRLLNFDFKHIAYKVDLLQHPYSQPNHQANNEGGASVSHSFMRAGFRSARKVAGLILPAGLKGCILKWYKALAHKSPFRDRVEEVLFSDSDVFLILSGDWSDNVFADFIGKLKEDTEFKILQIVYDMLPVMYPAYFVPGMPEQFTRYMTHMLPRCDGILSISQSTKRDVEYFQMLHKLRPTPVRVFRLGDDFVEQKEMKPTGANVIEKEFVLCVGTVEARKNHQLLYYMVKEAFARQEDILPIVIVGKKGWLTNDLLYLTEHDPMLKGRLVFLHDCTDQELSWLFKYCRLTVYPSFYEGWGLPIAESLFYNKFCLSSNTSSMPEIAGDLIEYFSPNNPIELLEKLLIYCQDDVLISKKEGIIKKKYKPTTWAESFLDVKDFVISYLG